MARFALTTYPYSLDKGRGGPPRAIGISIPPGARSHHKLTAARRANGLAGMAAASEIVLPGQRIDDCVSTLFQLRADGLSPSDSAIGVQARRAHQVLMGLG